MVAKTTDAERAERVSRRAYGDAVQVTLDTEFPDRTIQYVLGANGMALLMKNTDIPARELAGLALRTIDVNALLRRLIKWHREQHPGRNRFTIPEHIRTYTSPAVCRDKRTTPRSS